MTTVSRRTLLAAPVLAALGRVMPWASDAPSTAGAVPMFRGNPARTGEQPGPGPVGTPTRRWELRLGEVITTSPAVVGGVVYVGSVSPGTMAGGALHAVDSAGVERWRLATVPGDAILGSPAVVDGVVVTGSYDGIVIAAEADTGAELWRYQAEGSFYASPALHDGVAYLSDIHGHLYALGATDGDLAWRTVVGDGFARSLGSPALADGIVYGTSVSRRDANPTFLHAFDATSGQERWRYSPDDGTSLRGVPVVAAGVVYAPTRDSVLHVLDAATGEPHDRLDFGVLIQTDVAVVDGVAYVGSTTGELHALEVTTGQQRWARALTAGAALRSAPVVADGTVYVGDADGIVHASDAATGKERWHFPMRSLRSSPAVVDGVLYVGGRDGALRSVG